MERADFQHLIDALDGAGYRVVGPTVRDGAVVCDDVRTVTDLPVGWTDEQDPASYRLHRTDDPTLFGCILGPDAWKKYLFPPRNLMWQAEQDGDGVRFVAAPVDDTRLAFLGVRPCDLHAIEVQDRVFGDLDRVYRARRSRLFIVAVQCGRAARTCFCTSMNTGPRAESGFDLALTEVRSAGGHYFLVEVGTVAGRDLLATVPHRAASAAEKDELERATERAAAQITRTLETRGIKRMLYDNYDHPRWEQVAGRCMACANCTMVCPTCFCSTVEDVTDLAGGHAERWRTWDSCFTTDHSYLHGGAVRRSIRSRYRQWMTHKLATWIEQFGTSGCVGCGRCITWCPVGIDITEEMRVIGTSENSDGKEDH